MNFPKLICTSTIRSVQKGDSHGGIYVVDFEKDTFEQVVNWDNGQIDWEGRGGDRGLRGIEFYDNKTIISSSNELFFFDKDFNIIESYRNKYLKHSHELYRQGDKLFITSTGYDSILIFDLPSRIFEKGFCIRPIGKKKKTLRLFRSYFKFLTFKNFEINEFDPLSNDGPSPADIMHINHVKADGDEVYISGTKFNSLIGFSIKEEKIVKMEKIHYGTHNSQYYGENVLFNDTKEDRAILKTPNGKILKRFNIKEYETNELSNTEIPKDHARTGFCRGMAIFDNYLAIGYSPSTISLFDINGNGVPIKTINLSKDIRNSIHGLSVYPY